MAFICAGEFNWRVCEYAARDVTRDVKVNTNSQQEGGWGGGFGCCFKLSAGRRRHLPY